MATKWIGALVGALLGGIVQAATFVPGADTVALDGHVLPALAEAKTAPDALSAAEPLTLTVVLRYRDMAGFERYYADVYDSNSPSYRKFLSPGEIADRFGATREDYAAVESWFVERGFTVSEGSSNRLTLTLRGTREAAERALSVRINDYTLDKRTFYANDTEPRLPADIAARVQAIVGLSNLATPRPQWNAIVNAFKAVLYPLCKLFETPVPGAIAPATGGGTTSQCDPLKPPTTFGQDTKSMSLLGAPVPWGQARGNGQKVGIVAFDSYVPSDVANYLAIMGFPASQMSKLSQVHVNGGAPLGANQPEVLLDATTILTTATGASVVVFDAPFTGGGTSFQSIFNAMITNNVTIISNSWAYCENQTTLADVTSIDTIFMTAAAAGITVFNATGDSGSTCLNGAPNTVTVPASSPNATAVGGTSITMGPGSTYISETWWDGTLATPQTGQGGFGVSKFFTRPAYQNGFTASATRSIPDVAINADPVNGSLICQASAGGCPTGQLWGGTSASAPIWAALAAQMNEAQGTNLGFLNPQLYALAGTNAFHDAASMGSNFAHVGLGSPNSNRIHLALAGQTVGAVSAVTSSVVPYASWYTPYSQPTAPPPPADGATPINVVVWLRDANGNMVSGKTVSLTASPPGAIITPASGVTSVANGAVVFTVTNATPGTVTFTATDVTDSLTLTPQSVKYAVPPAASGGISASPNSVLNDGIATTTITVTLLDALSRPTPGKLVTLSQGAGHSIVTGPSPAVTNAAGQIQFTATNLFAETVTYTAIDVTDGNLPVPGTAVVNFTGQPTSACANPPPSVAAPGFALSVFSSGYTTGNVFYGNVNWGCRGVQNPAFAVDGSVLATDFVDGAVFRLPASGGIADSGSRIATMGPSLFQPVTGKDGRMYVYRGATTGNFTTGAIYEIDPVTGATIRTVLGNLTCPTGLAVDPLSGDLFYAVSCFGAGSDDPNIYRIANPASASPTRTIYYTLPGTPNGWLAFARDGTLFIAQFVTGTAPVLRITGTDKPQPATATPVPGLDTLYWVTLGESNPDGSAKSLIVFQGSKVRLANITTNPPTFTDLIDNGLGTGIVGPDGCLYIGALNSIQRLSLASGGCGFSPSVPVPGLVLTPASASQPQGNAQTLTAQFAGPAPATGTPVYFTIAGANARTLLATTDATGKATASYNGVFTGTDTVKASATVSATAFTSNDATITWGAGKHVSVISLNPAPTAGTVGTALQLRVQLLDSSLTPNASIAGASVTLSLGALSCNAVTDAQGFAQCTVTPVTAGTITLTATYAGSATYTSSTASTQVVIVAALPSLTATPPSVDFGSVAVGVTSSAVAVQVTNGGTAAYAPTSIALGGAQPGDFLLGTGSNACATGTPIAAGGSCFLYPAFKPTATGARSATLTLSDGTTPLVVPLTGTGAAAPPSCVTGAVAGGNATACVTGSLPTCTFSSAAFVPASSIPTPPPTAVTLPWGLLQFQATGCGAQATVVITYPATLPAGTSYYKYGPTVAQPADHWYTLPSSVAGNTITVTFVDGGAGDSDLAVNGTIRDPGGAGFVQAVPPVVTNVPTLDRWALGALALLLMGFAARSLRRSG